MNVAGRRLDAVLFDMDGVLVDSTASHVAAWSRFLDEQRLARPEAGIPSLFGRRAVEAVAGLLQVEPASDEARDAVAILERYADGLLYAAAPGASLVPGADGLVRGLLDDGWRVAVATSARREVAEHSLGPLLSAFETVVAAEDVVHGKPDPEVYLTAAARLGVSAGTATVVEDAPAGVTAGRDAGMRVIGIASTASHGQLRQAGAETVVGHLGEVAPILAAHRERRREERAGTIDPATSTRS